MIWGRCAAMCHNYPGGLDGHLRCSKMVGHKGEHEHLDGRAEEGTPYVRWVDAQGYAYSHYPADFFQREPQIAWVKGATA